LEIAIESQTLLLFLHNRLQILRLNNQKTLRLESKTMVLI